MNLDATVTVAGLPVTVSAMDDGELVTAIRALKARENEIKEVVTDLNQLSLTMQVFNNPPPQASVTQPAATPATSNPQQPPPGGDETAGMKPGDKKQVGTGALCGHNAPSQIWVGISKKNNKPYRGTYCGLHGKLSDRTEECKVQWDD